MCILFVVVTLVLIEWSAADNCKSWMIYPVKHTVSSNKLFFFWLFLELVFSVNTAFECLTSIYHLKLKSKICFNYYFSLIVYIYNANQYLKSNAVILLALPVMPFRKLNKFSNTSWLSLLKWRSMHFLHVSQ